MNKKGFEMKLVNLILMVILIVVLLWLLKTQVLDSVDTLSDCEKSKGFCDVICGPGMDQLPKKCPKEGDVCCIDPEKLIYGKDYEPEDDDAQTAVNKQIDAMKKKAVAENATCETISMFDLKEHEQCQYEDYEDDVDELNRLTIIRDNLKPSS